jgi:hypothetical protein
MPKEIIKVNRGISYFQENDKKKTPWLTPWGDSPPLPCRAKRGIPYFQGPDKKGHLPWLRATKGDTKNKKLPFSVNAV